MIGGLLPLTPLRAALLGGLFGCWLVILGLGQALAFDRFTAHGGPVRHLTLSPDGMRVVSASFDYSAVLWSSPDLVAAATLYGHEAAVSVARFSPDGTMLATTGDDALIQL